MCYKEGTTFTKPQKPSAQKSIKTRPQCVGGVKVGGEELNK